LKFPIGSLFNHTNGFTIFHVARYSSSTLSVQRRIFNATPNNWLSGFYARKLGIYYFDGFKNSGDVTGTFGIETPTSWWLGVATSETEIRINKNDLPSASAGTMPGQLEINYTMVSDLSEWEVAEFIYFNRILDIAEIETVENYLYTKYFTDS